eukprot:GHVO01034491.1.p1 GENE.GHVO01034491.1~~GHVO01034491.1.p1  ORF type:complete len:134 (+),score=18.74 GHVO01034491.1:537-938(+)
MVAYEQRCPISRIDVCLCLGNHHRDKMVKEIATSDEFKSFLASNRLAVIDFHAIWCGPCKVLAPKLAELEQTYGTVKFAKVDVDNQALSGEVSKYEITAMPTLKFFVDGEVKGTVQGANVKTITDNIEAIAKL